MQIFELYPDATDYRSVIRSVGPAVRAKVSEDVGFDLNARELGQHTLYVALQHGRPLGLVHVRSELSDWGLIEVVWALDLDLRVRDFRLQRCRGPACARLESSAELHAALQGRDFSELERWLRGEPMSAPFVPGIEPSMIETLLRSATKTISVTGIAWRPELLALRVR